MPRPWELKEKLNLVTADFPYVRWLGDRKGIEEKIKIWNKTIVDWGADLKNWKNLLRDLVIIKKVRKLVAYANNHYAGHGPATVLLFQKLWEMKEAARDSFFLETHFPMMRVVMRGAPHNSGSLDERRDVPERPQPHFLHRTNQAQ
jgi:hypothetical protein